MSFYLYNVIKFLMPSFREQSLKNAAMLTGVALSDVSVFVTAGLMLARLGNIRSTSILIVVMFAAVSVSFFCRRLFLPQLSLIADKAIIKKRSDLAGVLDKAALNDALREIGCRRASITAGINAVSDLIILVIAILCFSPLIGVICIAVAAFCIYISGRQTAAIHKSLGKQTSSLSDTSDENEDDEIMTDDDNELYKRNEVAETEAEVKSLLYISGIVGWTVSCFVPVILGQTLSQCTPTAIMQLCFVLQIYRLADTFSDISIITYYLDKIDNME